MIVNAGLKLYCIARSLVQLEAESECGELGGSNENEIIKINQSHQYTILNPPTNPSQFVVTDMHEFLWWRWW